MLGWHVPDPDQAMLISGSRRSDGAPFKIVTGHGAFALPLRSRVSYLTLAMQEAEVAEPCVTQQGVTLQARAVIAFKVGDDHESIANAARRFLSDQMSMSKLVGRVFAGHLRSIVGSMTVEEIIRERQKLAGEVLDASKPEMAELGLKVDSFQIESIDDAGSGYIQALSQPHVAAVNQAAQIAQAQADQAAAQARQESARNQAAYEKDTAIARANYKAEQDRAAQTAAQAGPLAEAQARRDVLEAQAQVAEREAALREKQLVTEVRRPAEAEAQRVRILAAAEADAAKLQAQVVADTGGIALQRMFVEKLPDMMQAAAAQLAGWNVTVVGGSDGLANLVAGLATQGGALLGALRSSLDGLSGGIADRSGIAADRSEIGAGRGDRADRSGIAADQSEIGAGRGDRTDRSANGAAPPEAGVSDNGPAGGRPAGVVQHSRRD